MDMLFIGLGCLLGGFVAGTITGSIHGFRKRQLADKERRVQEMIRCEALQDTLDSNTKSVHSRRCELESGHTGPHRYTVSDRYENAGDHIWWTDKE